MKRTLEFALKCGITFGLGLMVCIALAMNLFWTCGGQESKRRTIFSESGKILHGLWRTPWYWN